MLVEPERWSLELSRYVHFNPVRIAQRGLGKRARAERRLALSPADSAAEIAERLRVLREFRWSSHRAYVGLEPAPSWLCVEEVCAKLGKSRENAKKAYRAYVEEAVCEGLEERPWQQVQAQLFLGGASLKRKVWNLLRGTARKKTRSKGLGQREFKEVIAVVSQLKGEAWSDFRDRHGDWGRDLALWLGRAHRGLGLRELGELAGGINYATVSAATSRWPRRMANDKSLAKLSMRAVQLLNEKT